MSGSSDRDNTERARFVPEDDPVESLRAWLESDERKRMNEAMSRTIQEHFNQLAADTLERERLRPTPPVPSNRACPACGGTGLADTESH